MARKSSRLQREAKSPGEKQREGAEHDGREVQKQQASLNGWKHSAYVIADALYGPSFQMFQMKQRDHRPPRGAVLTFRAG